MGPKEAGSTNGRYYSQDAHPRIETTSTQGMTRRDFVAALSAAAVAGRLPALPRLARRLPRIGLQLYTVRKPLLLRTWQNTLAEIGAIGYREVEFAGYFGQQPATIRKVLDRVGLTADRKSVV